MIKINDNRGFTLIEVIISIAILSIVSVIVLQLFVSSKELNTESRSIDIAGVYAANAIERTKSLTRKQINSISGSQVEYYDDNWKLTTNADESRYVLTLIVEELQELSVGLYKIRSIVSENGVDKLLVEYNTAYYAHQKE